MSKKITPKRERSTLQQAVYEISSRMTNIKTSTDESRGIATVSGEKDGQLLSYSIRQSGLGKIGIQSVYDKLPRKADYKDEVKSLYRDGYKQREIAAMLGISQSLVSKLLHS